jgi:hypothetical protein
VKGVYNPNLYKMNLSLCVCEGDDGGVMNLEKGNRGKAQRMSSSSPDLFFSVRE